MDSQLNSTQSKEDKEKLIESHRLKETALLRMRRRKLTIDCFEIIDVIGKGGFGKVSFLTSDHSYPQVYLAKDKMTSEFVALKKVKKSLILELNKVESVRTEREVLKETLSPWLIRLICSFQDDKHLYLAMVRLTTIF